MRMIQVLTLLLSCAMLLLSVNDSLARSEPIPTLTITSQSGEAHSFITEIATTPKQQAKGLMFRESMPKNHGMLFINSTPIEMVMWMKNTLIPLDMLFIGSDSTITHIHRNAEPHSLTHIKSHGKAAAVLEINGGLAKALNINIGDTVSYDIP